MLEQFYPRAQRSEWREAVAGQRVEIIKPDPDDTGALVFGTELVGSADKSIAVLLGASPGASTAVPLMLDVMQRCFSDRYQGWLPKLKQMVPSLGAKLSAEPKLFEEVWSWGSKVLLLDRPMAAIA
jgi:malate dehydrogenase (quinone)